MSKIQKNLNILKGEYQEWKKSEELEVAKANAEREQTAEDEAKYLMGYVHCTLEYRIAASCGLDDVTEVYLPMFALGSARSDLAELIKQKVYKYSGMKIESKGKGAQSHDVLVDLSGEGKNLTITRRTWTETLNFRDLFMKNRRWRELWRENLPTLAKQMLNGLKKDLESMPDRFYGIPESLVVQVHNYD